MKEKTYVLKKKKSFNCTAEWQRMFRFTFHLVIIFITSPVYTRSHMHTLIISVLDRMIWYTAGHCTVFPLNYHYTFTNHCEPWSKIEGLS